MAFLQYEDATPMVLRKSIFSYLCCDRKARASCAQNFTLWQQATIEITYHDHFPRTLVIMFNQSHVSIGRAYTSWSLLLLVRTTHIWVLFFTHIPFVVNHTFNVTSTERLQQHSLLFITNCTYRMFFLWSLHLAQPSHPGHSTILLESESPSIMCAKLRTVATSNNRDHMPWSLSTYASHYVQSFTC